MSTAKNTLDSEEILDRAMIRANRAMFTIDMQIRRIGISEPEDAKFLGRRIADFEFLVVAATRLRRAANLAKNAPETRARITMALVQFDRSLPALKKLRDIAEHIDAYSIDQGFDEDIDRLYLENCMITNLGQTWTWLGETINTNDVLDASMALFRELARARDQIDELPNKGVNRSSEIERD
jgi:hypothetical protein